MGTQKEGGGQGHASAPLTRGTNWYQFYRRLGDSQSQSGRVGKILSPPVFGLRPVCPVASLLLYKNNTHTHTHTHTHIYIYIYIVNVKRKVTSLSKDPRWYRTQPFMLRPVLTGSDEDSSRLCCYDDCRAINSQSWKEWATLILKGWNP